MYARVTACVCVCVYVCTCVCVYVCVCMCARVYVCGRVVMGKFNSVSKLSSRLLHEFSYFVLVSSDVLGRGDNEKEFFFLGCPF